MNFVWHRAGLLMYDVHTPFWKTRYNMYADAVSLKSNALKNVVALSDGTNLEIARLSGRDIDHQRVACNGHKRKHSLKYQALTTSCGLAMHLAGAMEVRRRDWTLYLSSGIDSTLGPTYFFASKYFMLPTCQTEALHAHQCFPHTPDMTRVFESFRAIPWRSFLKRSCRLFPVTACVKLGLLLAHFTACSKRERVSPCGAT